MKLSLIKRSKLSFHALWHALNKNKWETDEDSTSKELEFIWGIKSSDDMSCNPCGLDTMNDIDIIYDRDKERYLLGIETIFWFDNGFEGQLNYINRLLENLTDWMKGEGHNVELKPDYDNVLYRRMEFMSIEELYATFRCLVLGFNCCK